MCSGGFGKAALLTISTLHSVFFIVRVIENIDGFVYLSVMQHLSMSPISRSRGFFKSWCLLLKYLCPQPPLLSGEGSRSTYAWLARLCSSRSFRSSLG